MQTYKLLVTTEQPNGRTRTEHVRHLTEDQLVDAREAARRRQPRGSVFKVKVVKER